ncbi:hypothetical protein ACFLSJ_02785 [Verrucomicrobiota bacterium]
MKTSYMLLVLATFVAAALGRPGNGFPADAEIPGLKYISDPEAFLNEGSEKLTHDQKKALRFAKAVLSLYLEAEVRGEFRIPEAGGRTGRTTAACR